ncbi:phosphatase PAP2 family protein [Fulvimarina sp. MAC3]|uniref:phosphatase PAP2 family protein n=1 Tax=Fulvimarina sp. MAC3 TaxID=3148887 RepID=UPI0031FD7A09
MPTQFDLSVFGFIHGLAPDLLMPFEERAAVWLIGLVPLTLIALWFRNRGDDRMAVVAATISAGGAVSIAGIMSFLVFEPHPFMIGLCGNVLHHVADSSFPSGYMALTSAVAASLELTKRRGAAIAIAVAAVLIGWSRIAIGVHFPIDILAGAAIGVTMAVILQSAPVTPFFAFVLRLGEGVSAAIGLDRIGCLVGRSSASRFR